ncbi:SusC/RagA family TonB-linked outer membrane protein [Thermoflexibacter ruber]|nr:TonB-dependent receptor [Thermoflexibacter ruber]
MKMKNKDRLWVGYIPILSFLFFFLISSFSYAQKRVSGKVTDSDGGAALPGVTVLVKGTSSGTATDADGNYSISVPAGSSDVLVFSFVGYKTQEVAIGNQSTINVSLVADVTALQEVVVTGYGTEQKKDIIGAVAVVSTKELLATPAGNITQQLQGRAAGVVIGTSGAPGAGAKVRIRGFNSFGGNDPLYIIDGVPTTAPNAFNPQDVESLQVLKDATAASIYGARASNGVVIITTKQGKAGRPKLSYDTYYGMQSVNRFPELLNPTQYGELLWTQFRNAGQTPTHPIYGSGPTPVIPEFLVAGPDVGVNSNNPNTNPALYNVTDFSRPIHQITRANREGTDWYKEIFKNAPIQSHQISASGGTDAATYSLGLNYFNQRGVVIHTGYERFTVRANTMFKPKDRIRIGENMQISYEELVGTQADNPDALLTGEGGAIAQAYRMQSIVPVYDINGNFAGTRGAGLGNASSPVADQARSKDNKNFAYRIFGNVFAELDILKDLTFRSSFGLDFTTRYRQAYGFRTFERAENTASNSYSERNDWGRSWTFTNTLTYKKTFAEDHNVKVMVGTEAIKINGRGVGGSRINFFVDDPDFRVLDRGQPVGQNNFSYGFRESLYSLFGRADYTFKDRYLMNITVRRDGSSKFGPENRFGVFPAIGLGWRISQEEFMKDITWITDLKLRGGWGQVGSQNNVSAANQYSFYRSTPGNSSYDITGSSTNVVAGFDLDRIGNLATKWETGVMTNIGIDATLFDGKWDINAEWYTREAKGLLIGRQAPFTEPDAAQPAINVGNVRNRGIDLAITNRGNITEDLRYTATLTVTRYKNEVLNIDGNPRTFFTGGDTRFGNVTRTQQGLPVSVFWGYIIDGFFNTESEATAAPNQPIRKKVGGWKLRDINGDGVVNADDQTNIGSPHPKLQTGLNVELAYKGFDFSMFLFWNYGNSIFNYNRWWIDFNSFQGNRSTRMLNESWTPQLGNAAKLPILDVSDNQSGNIPSTYYIESGSYLRMRTMQLGYTIPKSLLNKVGIASARAYIQGQNLFTVTPYSGTDPDVALQNNNQGDLGLGVDRGLFPNSRQLLIGINIGF